jgi:hypothetical protein
VVNVWLVGPAVEPQARAKRGGVIRITMARFGPLAKPAADFRLSLP